MHSSNQRSLALSLYLDRSLTPLVSGLADQAGKTFGLASGEAMKLGLACEEVYSYLCGCLPADDTLELKLTHGGYRVLAEFMIGQRTFNMRAFNLTSRVSVDDQDSMEEMGLLLASRMVDSLYVDTGPHRDLVLRMTKEKAYPPADDEPMETPSFHGPTSCREAGADDLKMLVRIIRYRYPVHLYPPSFAFPGKLVDMVGQGGYEAMVACDDRGHIVGGLVWHSLKATVECFGPYMAAEQPEAAEVLVEAFLAKIARTGEIGVINRFATPDLPAAHFEKLGELRCGQGGLVRPAFFRLLGEDDGCTVWSHADLEPFLRETYARLFFPRDIYAVAYQGEDLADYSVIGTEFHKQTGEAVLRPILAGKDCEKNVADHVDLMTREGVQNLLFEMDLGESGHALFTPALLQSGFRPGLLIPYGAKADLVVWQRDSGSCD